jgi:hypothetical protein
MNSRAAFIAYIVTIAGSVSYLSTYLISTPYYGYYGYFDTTLFLRNIMYSAGIGGMIVGPYFGVAALSVKKGESVWSKANILIHGHISIPFIGALALAWGGGVSVFSGPFYQGMAIIPYTIFVILGTLITFMASRAAAAVVIQTSAHT